MANVVVIDPVEPKAIAAPSNRFAISIGSCFMSIVAALATWGALCATHPFFTVPSSFNIGMGASNEARIALLTERARADQKNAMVAFTVGGVLMSSVLGFIASGCCSGATRISIAIPWGAFVGVATGFLGSVFYTAINPNGSFPSTTNSGLGQAIAFGIFGAGLGLLYGAFSQNKFLAINATFVGCIAGAAGGLLFPIVTGLLMPNEN
ncbi:MAG TPA: hypothetical protein VM260_02750, partial [Pirellula sp.]|nr:hypothetical protein [Pirellula sp.]